MKKEDSKFSFKKTLIIITIILIVAVAAFYYKKDYCEPEKYTITDTSSVYVTRNLEEWFNTFGGEFHCLDSREEARLVSGKSNYIVCGIKPRETGEYTVEITKANARVNRPIEIEKWFAEKKWIGNAIANEIVQSNIKVDIPQGTEGEALSFEVLLRKNNQLIATETLYFRVIEKDSFRESVC